MADVVRVKVWEKKGWPLAEAAAELAKELGDTTSNRFDMFEIVLQTNAVGHHVSSSVLEDAVRRLVPTGGIRAQIKAMHPADGTTFVVERAG